MISKRLESQPRVWQNRVGSALHRCSESSIFGNNKSYLLLGPKKKKGNTLSTSRALAALCCHGVAKSLTFPLCVEQLEVRLSDAFIWSYLCPSLEQIVLLCPRSLAGSLVIFIFYGRNTQDGQCHAPQGNHQGRPTLTQISYIYGRFTCRSAAG